MRHKTIQAVLGSACFALASERHFGWTTETAVLPEKAAEVEIWNTLEQTGDHFDQTIAQRLEFESGLGSGWQGAIYLDAKSETIREPETGLRTESSLDGFTLEIKKQLTNPDVSLLGSALYLEAGIRPDELELETKFLVDWHRGPWTVASNAIVEQAWAYTADPGTSVGLELDELPVDITLAASYAIDPRLGVGWEAVAHNDISRQEMPGSGSDLTWNTTTWSTGPSVSVGLGRGWIQLAGLAALGAVPEDQTAWTARIVAGFNL